MRKDLEERLIDFAVSAIAICRSMKKGDIEKHLGFQVVRSSSSAALNYGEAQSAESRKDFIHKISVVLKELRESVINLKIMQRGNLIEDGKLLRRVIDENQQLISIFHKTVQTAKQNRNKTEL